MTAAAAALPRRRLRAARLLRRHGWTVGVYVLLLGMILYWRTLPENFSSFEWQSLVQAALPLCFAAVAQAIVVIGGGIDLSVGAIMSVVNVLSAKYMVEDLQSVQAVSYRYSLLLAVLLIVGGFLAGALTGTLITVSGVPDIVVTLAMLFFYGGLALYILEVPGGGAPEQFVNLGIGVWHSQWIPTALLILAGSVALIWLPIRWAKPGLALYAVGSDRNAAYLSGIGVGRTRIFSYALGGAFAALGGLALTTTSFGVGSAHSGDIYTLNSVAAVVLGGVSLLGGKGGVIGPIAAAFILTLSTTILVLHGVDQNWVQVIQGSLVISVVLLGGWLLRTTRA
jgi:ribose transport system permease protein